MKKLLAIFLVLAVLVVSCQSEQEEPTPTSSNTPDQMNADPDEDPDPDPEETETVTFSKADGADPTIETNQDRITENVWITRGNDGGQIFNIRLNSSASKSNSPVDTEWAIGTTDNLENLTFAPFRSTVRPQQIVGENLVVHLITDDIFLNIRFTSWSSGKRGGFAYVRDAVTN